jgi:hypothetical protein
MGDAALGMLATRMTLLNGIGEFQDQKDRCGAPADRRDTDGKSECAHREWYRKLGLRRSTRILEAGGTAPGGDD